MHCLNTVRAFINCATGNKCISSLPALTVLRLGVSHHGASQCAMLQYSYLCLVLLLELFFPVTVATECIKYEWITLLYTSSVVEFSQFTLHAHQDSYYHGEKMLGRVATSDSPGSKRLRRKQVGCSGTMTLAPG